MIRCTARLLSSERIGSGSPSSSDLARRSAGRRQPRRGSCAGRELGADAVGLRQIADHQAALGGEDAPRQRPRRDPTGDDDQEHRDPGHGDLDSAQTPGKQSRDQHRHGQREQPRQLCQPRSFVERGVTQAQVVVAVQTGDLEHHEHDGHGRQRGQRCRDGAEAAHQRAQHQRHGDRVGGGQQPALDSLTHEQRCRRAWLDAERRQSVRRRRDRAGCRDEAQLVRHRRPGGHFRQDFNCRLRLHIRAPSNVDVPLPQQRRPPPPALCGSFGLVRNSSPCRAVAT